MVWLNIIQIIKNHVQKSCKNPSLDRCKPDHAGRTNNKKKTETMPTGVTSSSSSEETVEVEEGSSEEYAPEATAKSAARPKAASVEPRRSDPVVEEERRGRSVEPRGERRGRSATRRPNGHGHLRRRPRAKARVTKLTTEWLAGSATSLWATTLPQCRSTSTGTGPAYAGNVTELGQAGRKVLPPPRARSKGGTTAHARNLECLWRPTRHPRQPWRKQRHARDDPQRRQRAASTTRTQRVRRTSAPSPALCRLVRRFARSADTSARRAAATVRATGHQSITGVHGPWSSACQTMANEPAKDSHEELVTGGRGSRGV